jgi:hypothetical protein
VVHADRHRRDPAASTVTSAAERPRMQLIATLAVGIAQRPNGAAECDRHADRGPVGTECQSGRGAWTTAMSET